jgi:hypothetical protein
MSAFDPKGTDGLDEPAYRRGIHFPEKEVLPNHVVRAEASPDGLI